jgi:hypothetical protein
MGWAGPRNIGPISAQKRIGTISAQQNFPFSFRFFYWSRPGRARSKVQCMNSGREYNSRPLFMREQ